MRILCTLVSLALVSMSLLSPSCVSGSHFEFGSMIWTRDPLDSNLYTFRMTSGWRANYPDFQNQLNKLSVQVGDTVDVGSVFFFNQVNGQFVNPSIQQFPAGSASGVADISCPPSPWGINTCSNDYGQVPVTLHARVTAMQLVNGTSAADEWFVGTWTSDPIDINNVLGSGKQLKLPFLVQFMQCCRSSTPMDNNHDINFFIGTIVGKGDASPITTSRVREYAVVNSPISYFVPGVSLLGHPLSYSFSATQGGLNSQLVSPMPKYPADSRVPVTLNPTTGQLTWTPNTLINKNTNSPALYAIQFMITDTVTKSAIVLDIMFQIIDRPSTTTVTPTPALPSTVSPTYPPTSNPNTTTAVLEGIKGLKMKRSIN